MVHNVVVQRERTKGEWDSCLVYSSNDNDSFENFACALLNAYDDVKQKYEHKYAKGDNNETIFFILKQGVECPFLN